MSHVKGFRHMVVTVLTIVVGDGVWQVRTLVEGCDDREAYDPEDLKWEEEFEARQIAFREKQDQRIHELLISAVEKRGHGEVCND